MGKITPFLWFDQDAEEVLDLYCSIFQGAKVHSVIRYPEGSPFPAGTVITAHFELAGQEFIALNGGPAHRVPPILMELMSDPDPDKAGRTMQAMLGMTKLDIAALQAAHDGS